MKRYPSCILCTCCVPWDEQWRFEEETFRRGVREMLTGTPHLYVFGTAGEGYAVTDRQFDQIVAAFTDEMRQAGADPMVGIIHLSLGTILERIDRCRERGIRQFQISLPSWGALTQREVFDYFRAVCGRFPDCQFVHYNLPRTKRLVSPDEYVTLAAENPNLVGTKNCGDSMAFLERLISLTPDLQHFLSETGYFWGNLYGECGLLASYVTNWPKVQAVFDAGKRKDLAAIAELQRDVRTFGELIGTLTDFAHIDGAFDKLFARLKDPTFPIRMLPPYAYVNDDQFEKFAAAFRERLPEWSPGE